MNFMIGKSREGNTVYRGHSINEHITLIGASGTGKSTAALKLILNAVESGDLVIVLNWRNSFSADVLGERADIYKMQRKVIIPSFEGIKIPLFSPYRSNDNVIEPTALMVNRICKLFAQSVGLSDAQQYKVKQAISDLFELDAYHEDGISSLEVLLSSGGSSAEKAIEKMSPFFVTNLLRDGDFISSENMPIIEIDINDFELCDQKVIVEFLLAWLFQYGQKGGFKEHGVVIYIDEAQNLSFKSDSPIYMLLNESRKFNIKLLMAMPSIRAGCKRGMDITTMAGTNLFFKPMATDLEYAAKLIDSGNKSRCIKKLSLLKVGECLATGSFIINNKEVNRPTTLISVGCEPSVDKLFSTSDPK